MKKCFFIGHRDTPETIYPLLLQTVIRHIGEYGVSEFWVGSYGSFDRMAARAVLQAKKTFPSVRLIGLLPYHPAVRPSTLPGSFDGSVYPFDEKAPPPRFAILLANQYAIRQCDFLISYACHPGGNAQKLVNYARKRNTIRVANLAE